ncbi:MAG TPA: hypothetical protein VMV92_04615 [Streptosporangiaceae bacterium]|nr:hypothetical protein [Streptosporangiaceae bacterium]
MVETPAPSVGPARWLALVLVRLAAIEELCDGGVPRLPELC